MTELKKSKQDIEGTASDIKGTSTKLESSIGTATDASERFDQLINECQSIIDKIRKQPAENKSYTIGVGGGSNGLGLYASKDKTWMYLDKDTATIGWQINF
mgnify:CR=1 FL=1